MTTEQRIEKVEKQLAQLKWHNRLLFVCIVLFLTSFFLWKTLRPNTALAASGAKEIRANRFVLENENGDIRAFMLANDAGTVLTMCDENGKQRSMITVTKDISELILHDENGKERIKMKVVNSGPGLAMMDKKGNTRILLSMLEAPGLSLYDENDKARANLFLLNGYPFMIFNDENGKEILSVPK